jgi:hypothetical protein
MGVRRGHPLWADSDLSVERRAELVAEFQSEDLGPLGSEWTVLRWSEFFARIGVSPQEQDWWDPRRFHTWAFDAGPNLLGVLSPAEGDLDPEVLLPLLRCLADHSALASDTPCFVYWDHVAVFWQDDSYGGKLYEGPLGEIPSLIGPGGDGDPPDPSPTNFWPTDRSWFVFTDPDSSATKVSGSTSLIGALRAHPDLETIDWAPASG